MNLVRHPRINVVLKTAIFGPIMQKKLIAISLATLCALSVPTGCGGGTSGTGGNTLKGLALDSRGQPLAGLKIQVTDAEERSQGSITTTLDGAFSISEIQTDSNILTASPDEGPVTKIHLGFENGSSSTTVSLSQRASGFFDASFIKESIKGTTGVGLSGNLDAASSIIDEASLAPLLRESPEVFSFRDLQAAANFSTVVSVFDNQLQPHLLSIFFFHSASGEWVARVYANAEEVSGSEASVGSARVVSPVILLEFKPSGPRIGASLFVPDAIFEVSWIGATASDRLELRLSEFTSYAFPSNLFSVWLE